MLDKGDIQKMQGRGASRTGLGTTGVNRWPQSANMASHMTPGIENG